MVTAKERLEGYTPIDVCIMSHHYVGVLMKQSFPDDGSEAFYEDSGYKVRVASYNMAADVGKQWGANTFTAGLSSPLIVHTKHNEYLLTDKTRTVYYAGVGANKSFEDDISENIPAFGLVNIEGVIFAATVARRLYVRNGPSDWEKINDAYDIQGVNEDCKGFRALDGFSLSDIYAAGGDRDVWHFNYPKREWRPIDINCSHKFECTTVCCAEDGNVYIGGEFGMIARGKAAPNGEITWESKRLDIGDIKKIVSYKGKNFVGTERFTYVLNDDITIKKYDFEGEVTLTGGHMMYTAHGMMIVANYFGQVALHDGEKWQNLYGCETLNPIEQQATEEDYNQAMDELGEAAGKFLTELEKARRGR